MTDKTAAYIGRTPDAERVYVEISLENRDGKGFKSTSDHAPIGEYIELSITGNLVAHRGRSINACGQIVEYVQTVSPETQRVVGDGDSGWTRHDIRSLTRIWRQWHLNGMSPGCDHMELPDSLDWQARKDIVCPETGYKYGSAWLVRELPAEVIAEVRRLMALPAGRIPEYVAPARSAGTDVPRQDALIPRRQAGQGQVSPKGGQAMSSAEIGTTTRNGLFQIVDTNWDHNGTLRVTVRELVGDGCLDMSDARMIQAMRRLARRALMYPDKTRSSRVVNRFTDGGSKHVTFAVSRLEPWA